MFFIVQSCSSLKTQKHARNVKVADSYQSESKLQTSSFHLRLVLFMFYPMYYPQAYLTSLTIHPILFLFLMLSMSFCCWHAAIQCNIGLFINDQVCWVENCCYHQLSHMYCLFILFPNQTNQTHQAVA